MSVLMSGAGDGDAAVTAAMSARGCFSGVMVAWRHNINVLCTRPLTTRRFVSTLVLILPKLRQIERTFSGAARRPNSQLSSHHVVAVAFGRIAARDGSKQPHYSGRSR